MFTRRRFLASTSALAAATALPARAARFQSDPFALGVASGYPTPDGFVLWTRLAPKPLAPGGGVDPVAFPVRWEVARDEKFSAIAASGTAEASPDWAHSVHVEPKGLEPDRWYWYRFIAGDAASPTGRARTGPRLDSSPQRLRFAFASCQQYEQGYFNAYRHIVADEPDLIAFLGDYIYESSWGREHVRKHGAGEPVTLDEYRARHALYRTDADLQAAHAACPWIVTWDDHEVLNDYAADRPDGGMTKEQFLVRRSAAYKAYYEHLPLPERMRPDGAHMQIYTQVVWGSLARFYVLDDRQYRSWHACRRPDTRSAPVVDIDSCPKMFDASRSMLGSTQERWLEGALARSDARWNVLAQQTMMAQFDRKPGPGRSAWTDGWDGYPAARQRLLAFLRERRIANPVVIGGDVHSFNVSNLKLDFDDRASATVASEFIGTSITSQAWPQEKLNEFLSDNPHILLADSRRRGYVRVEVAPGSWRADLRVMESVRVRGAACGTLATFVVENGKPGPLYA